MLRVKYESLPLSKLSDIELFKAARLLLLKIHVIVGWTIPEKELKDILTDQFTKKIKESYVNVNADEIEYAFRQNISVQDWGKSMNLSLIDEVVSEYLEKRLDISRLEEKYRQKPFELPPIIDLMNDDEFIEMNFKTWSVLKNPGIISTKCYGILVDQGKINLTQEQKDEMYRIAEIKLTTRVGTEKEAHNSKRVYDHELLTIYTSPNKNHWKARVFNECKKLAVENYFKTV